MAATKYKSRGSDTSSSSGSTAARDPKVTKVTEDFVDDYRPVPAARSYVLHRFLARSALLFEHWHPAPDLEHTLLAHQGT
jgi:hypothetical protein